jgi:hypothetical protein
MICPCASGQVGIESPDPLSRTIPPHTTRAKTSTSVAMKKVGRRLGFAEIAGLTGVADFQMYRASRPTG